MPTELRSPDPPTLSGDTHAAAAYSGVTVYAATLPRMVSSATRKDAHVAEADTTDLQTKCNEQALRHLLRFEAAVITAFRVKDAFSTQVRRMIAQEAQSATALAGLPCPWRSRPMAILVVAEQARVISTCREYTDGDVDCMMKAIEASWTLDPDVTLSSNSGEQREAFDLWVEELTDRAAGFRV